MNQIVSNLSLSLNRGISKFVFIGSSLYVITNTTTAGGLNIFKSTDYGTTFIEVGSISLVAEFNPSICVDTSSNIHIIGVSSTSLTKYTFSTSGNSFSGPYTIFSSNLTFNSYDICILPTSGNCLVVASYVDGNNLNKVSSVEVNSSTGSLIGSPLTVVQSTWKQGDLYENVNLIANSTGAELYLTARPKVLDLSALFSVEESLSIETYTYTSPTWGAMTTLQTLNGQFTENNLRVIPNSSNRYLSINYSPYRGINANSYSTNTLLGYYNGTAWSFSTIINTSSAVISVGVGEVNLAYLEGSYSGLTTLPLKVGTLDFTNWSLTSDSLFKFQTQMLFLQGSHTTLPANMHYGFIAVDTSNTAYFFTGYNVAPVPALSPTSLNAVRNISYSLSAAGSYDPNMDSLQYTWSTTNNSIQFTPNGNNCTLFVPYNVGAGALSGTITVSVQDLDNNGNPINSPTTAQCAVTVSAVSAPVITPAGPFSENRNSSVTFTPVVTSMVLDHLSYQWAQTQGTTVTVSSLETPSLTFSTAGVLIQGEEIGFTLTVDDHLNSPVSQTFQFNVAARTVTSENSIFLATSANVILNRNLQMVWPAASNISITSNLNNLKRFSYLNSYWRFLAISPISVVYLSSNLSGTTVTNRYYIPSPSDTISDATLLETNEVIILAASKNLFKYAVDTAIANDNVLNTIDLSNLSSLTYTSISSTVSHNGVHTLILYGASGCLLLETDSNFTVKALLELNIDSELLYGSNNVIWVRFSNLESVSSGLVLLGTLDADNNTYETLVDLSSKRIIQTWDISEIKNSYVDTGEILFQESDSYAGTPVPPVMGSVQSGNNAVMFNWNQTRPDLINYYLLQFSSNNTDFFNLQSISPGLTTSLNYAIAGSPLVENNLYYFRLQAVNYDGSSPWSNVVSAII